ncbi:hypothetical protein LMG3412_06118 [Achromobacter deleyi]|nr:hypothetical protein LMG3412_06118 [Achromobacter deleyi]
MIGLSRPPLLPPVAPPRPRPPVREATAPVALAKVAPSGLGLPGVALSRPPALLTAPPRPCSTPFRPATLPPGSWLPRLLTVPPRLFRMPATGAPSLVVAPTCCVRPTTVPATGLAVGSSAAPMPPSMGCRPSGRTLSTVLPTLPSAGSSKGLDGPLSTPPVTPPTSWVTGLSRPPLPDRPEVRAPTALVALPRMVVRGCGFFGSALSRPPVLATVLPRPSTRPPTPALRPPGRPVPLTVVPRPSTRPPTCLTVPSTGWPRPVVAPTCWVRPTTVSTTGLTVGSSALPTPPRVVPRFRGRVLSTALPVLPNVVCSRPVVTGLTGGFGSFGLPGLFGPPGLPGLLGPPGLVGISVPGKPAEGPLLWLPPPPPQAASELIRAAARTVEVRIRCTRCVSILAFMASSCGGSVRRRNCPIRLYMHKPCQYFSNAVPVCFQRVFRILKIQLNQ